MWARVSEFIIKYRLGLLILILVLTGFMFYKGKDVELSYSGAKVLPVDDPTYIAYNQFKNKFGEDGTILVVGVQSDKIFDQSFFNDWYQLSEYVRNINGIDGVVSITHAFELKKDTAKKAFTLQKLVSQPAKTQKEVDSIRSKIYSLPFYDKLILNTDSNTTLIAIDFDKDILNSNKRVNILDKILKKTNEFSEKHHVQVHYSGLPYIRTLISQKVSQEFQLFLTIEIIITALILLIVFRSFYAVIFPLLVVIVGVILSLGTLVLFDYKITLLTGLIPPLIVIIGVPNSILLLNKYHNEYRRHRDKIRALKSAIRRITVTTLLANVTTAIGFGVFYFTHSEVLTQFGIVAAINVLATWIISMILIPVIFSYLPAPKIKQIRHLENKFFTKVINLIDKLVHNHRKAIYITTIVIIIISFAGMSRININGYIVDDLPQNDPVYVDLKFFERNFEGILPLEIGIDTKKKNGLMNISTVRKIEKMTEMVSAYPEFSRSISVLEVLKYAKQAYYNGNPRFYKIPTDSEAAFIMNYTKRSGGAGNMIRSYVDSTNRETRVNFQMVDIGSKRMNVLLNEIKNRIDSILPQNKFNVLLTGSSIVFLEGTNYLLSNLRDSLILAIVLITILMLVLFRTARMVSISLLPNIIPLIITAGIMGFFDISLKPTTILIFSIAFGIASDQTLYFLTKFRHEQYTRDWSISKIVSETLKETGLSMIYTAIILFFGFGVFAASTFGGTVSLGILISITLLVALISNLILLPSLLLSLEKRINNKQQKENNEL